MKKLVSVLQIFALVVVVVAGLCWQAWKNYSPAVGQNLLIASVQSAVTVQGYANAQVAGVDINSCPLGSTGYNFAVTNSDGAAVRLTARSKKVGGPYTLVAMP